MAAALVIFGVSHEPISAISACLLGGVSWTVMLTKLYVSAQVALPDWARGRGLAVFLTFIFGATTAGSAIWGKLTELQGLQNTYFVAATRYSITTRTGPWLFVLSDSIEVVNLCSQVPHLRWTKGGFARSSTSTWTRSMRR
jgi:hypothetical protein